MPSNTKHLSNARASARSHPKWARVADGLTDLAPLLCGRDDVRVVVAPGAAKGAPGMFNIATAVIELDADVCFEGIDPATINLADLRDHIRYMEGLGAFCHECAHAEHSRWIPGSSWPGPVVVAAFILEDLRIEAAQIRRRPLDLAWLRAASLKLDVPDLRRTRPRAFGLWRAAAAAALCLGRVDAGILDPADPNIGRVRKAFVRALGKDLFAALETIWQQALTVADTDGPMMGALGAAWCRLLCASNTVIAAASDERQQALAAATDMAAAVLVDAAAASPTGSGGESFERPISDLFAYTRPPAISHPATGQARAAATRLAQALAEAAQPPREPTVVNTVTPPGKLNMRGALAGAAQRAAGAPVTAKPWRRAVRRRQPNPAVKVGIALDVSGSMDVFFAPAATAAWMLAFAAKQTGGMAAAATFGQRVRTLIAPGKVPAAIPVPELEWGTDHLDIVIDALDGALGLAKPDQHARLLFLITDGWLAHSQIPPVAEQCDKLRQAGCEVIQIGPAQSIALEACRFVEVADPIASLHMIIQTAATALRDAARRGH